MFHSAVQLEKGLRVCRRLFGHLENIIRDAGDRTRAFTL